ncbi:hypothetical protein [Streptomyces sp. KL116D]|uniref:hypothetical protein n=1 Tax=Streptomyces sp. KL116D TaxID=3045152 RepID=UPI0035589D8E
MGGLPWLLWQASTALAPGGWDALQHLFTRQDTGSVALLAVCAIGWLAWASFILSLLLQIPAQLRGVRAPACPACRSASAPPPRSSARCWCCCPPARHWRPPAEAAPAP